MSGQEIYLLLILMTCVGAFTGWALRGRRDSGLLERLRADVNQCRVHEAVHEERSLRIEEVQCRYIECNELLQGANAEVARLTTALELASNELKSCLLYTSPSPRDRG